MNWVFETLKDAANPPAWIVADVALSGVIDRFSPLVAPRKFKVCVGPALALTAPTLAKVTVESPISPIWRLSRLVDGEGVRAAQAVQIEQTAGPQVGERDRRVGVDPRRPVGHGEAVVGACAVERDDVGGRAAAAVDQQVFSRREVEHRRPAGDGGLHGDALGAAAIAAAIRPPPSKAPLFVTSRWNRSP
jgi:hypothetical protein